MVVEGQEPTRTDFPGCCAEEKTPKDAEEKMSPYGFTGREIANLFLFYLKETNDCNVALSLVEISVGR